MALIAMAVWDTEENGRTELTQRTLLSLFSRTDTERNPIIVVDNNSCRATKELLNFYQYDTREINDVIHLPENVGTAKAINQAWARRKPGQHCVKMDNDVEIETNHWLETLEECVEREPTIGIAGLKRKDCIETPWHTDPWYKSELMMLPHELGQRWLIVEKVNHVMGTCQLYSSACLDKIGFLYQMDQLYGFDDALASIRAQLAGFIAVHVPHIEIEHIDPGGTDYTTWKTRAAARAMAQYNSQKRALQLGHLPIWCNSEGKLMEKPNDESN